MPLRSPVGDAVFDGLLRVRVAAAIHLTVPLAIIGLWLVGDQAFPLHNHPVVALSTVAAFLVSGAVLMLRGVRVGDVEFALVLVLDQVLTVWIVGTVQQPGSAIALEWAGQIAILCGAVFARSRWAVAVVLTTGLAGMGLLTAMRLQGLPGLGASLVVEASMILFVTLIVRVLREVAGSALDQARRGEVTDPLTGASNRRGLERDGIQAWRDAGGRHARVALLVVDIDHFKRINDTLGHAEGDRVIKELAALLSAAVRGDDLVVRLGGEEFLVLLRTGREEALLVAERIRERVAAALAPVTISVGVADAVPGADDPLPEALWHAVDAADKALYAAKEGGRNRVVAAG